MIAERLMVGSEFGRFGNRSHGLRLIDGGKGFADLADVSRNGSSFSINDKRSYDAWSRFRFASFPTLCSAGFLRLEAQSVHISSGANTGDPKGRYPDSLRSFPFGGISAIHGYGPDSLRSFPFGGTSAIHGYGWLRLGHVEDDESNLIYMRARYYDPTSGRFISEDPDMQGLNWFIYCTGNPIVDTDMTGKLGQELSPDAILMWAIGTILDQLDRLGISLPPTAEAVKDLISYSLLASGSFEAGTSIGAIGAGCLLVGMESGDVPQMALGASLQVLSLAFNVVGLVYIGEGVDAILCDLIDSGD